MANDFDLEIKSLSGSRIEIQSTDAVSITGTEKVLIMQNGAAKETTSQDIANLGGGGGVVLTATVTLTDAQIKSLPSQPIEIVPAQGVNKVIIPFNCVLLSDFSSGAYSGNGSGSFDIQLTWGNNVINATRDVLLNMTDTTPEYNQLLPGHPNDGYNSSFLSQVNNASITVSSDNGNDLTGGNSSNFLTVVFYYTILDL